MDDRELMDKIRKSMEDTPVPESLKPENIQKMLEEQSENQQPNEAARTEKDDQPKDTTTHRFWNARTSRYIGAAAAAVVVIAALGITPGLLKTHTEAKPGDTTYTASNDTQTLESTEETTRNGAQTASETTNETALAQADIQSAEESDKAAPETTEPVKVAQATDPVSGIVHMDSYDDLYNMLKEWNENPTTSNYARVMTIEESADTGSANTAATSCPFCDNPIVMMGQFSGSLKPDLVIPFKLDKKAAKEGLMKHLTGKRLLPKIFKDQNHIDEIKGVYVPFWLFDTDVDAKVRYKATKIRTWSDSDYNYTQTSYYMVHRGGSVGFGYVPVDGSTKMADDLMESIEPFNCREAVDFQTAYLAGYLADKYDVTAEESIDRANERVKKSTEQAFAETVIGYDTVVAENTSVQFHGGKAKYALYPVWLLNTTWNGNKYTFAMNGQTGKFVGDLPVDKAAATRWTLVLAGAFTALTYGAATLLHFLGLF